MDALNTAESIPSIRSSFPERMEDFKEPRTIKRHFKTGVARRTDQTYEQVSEIQSLEIEDMEPIRLEGFYRETIREWWEGQVTKVHLEEGYFEATLKDLKGVEILGEFNIDQEQKDSLIGQQYLFSGAKFVFFVATKHGRGSPETVSRLEFTPPHIWREEDNKKVEELYKELFPED